MSRAKCFVLELMEEVEDIGAWAAGWADASGTQLADRSPSVVRPSEIPIEHRCAGNGDDTVTPTPSTLARHHGADGLPVASMPTTAEVAAARGKRLIGITRLAGDRDVFTAGQAY